jgi:hypothetical protein
VLCIFQVIVRGASACPRGATTASARSVPRGKIASDHVRLLIGILLMGESAIPRGAAGDLRGGPTLPTRLTAVNRVLVPAFSPCSETINRIKSERLLGAEEAT